MTDDVPEEDCVGSSLDDLIGSWTPEEADEFDAAVADFQDIDVEPWGRGGSSGAR
ncbi:hypothetical protein [Candidatus Poriferisodalis sp.]|uniref:hypothetical protein n=1 Tax=Candidatus Poriferisodalis sp. TaxID=3101277 RepID=UPI003B0153D2